jgi:hypothetical protein
MFWIQVQTLTEVETTLSVSECPMYRHYHFKHVFWYKTYVVEMKFGQRVRNLILSLYIVDINSNDAGF